MKALVKTALGVGNMALLDVEEPKVGPRDVLVRVGAAGICGTDVLIMQDKVRIYNPPVILGHNLAGTVAGVGAEVAGFAVGDRVAVDMNVGACGRCSYCRQEKEYLCVGRRGLGYGIDGGMAEYLSVGEQWLVKVPAGVPMEQACAMDVCNAIHTVVDRCQIRFGSSVAIFGPGFQGLSMLQVARLMGASPIFLVGLERHDERLKLARRLGADYAVASDREDLPRLVREVTGGRGVDAVLETSGAPSALAQGIAVARKGGCISMLGSLPEESQVDMHTVVYSELTLFGARGYNRANVHFFVDALAAGKLDVGSFVETFPLENWEGAFRARRERRVIEPVLVP